MRPARGWSRENRRRMHVQEAGEGSWDRIVLRDAWERVRDWIEEQRRPAKRYRARGWE